MMRPLFQPYFLIGLFVFVVHQIVQKCFEVSLPFIDSYLDDFFCLPILLPLLLVQKRFFERDASVVLSTMEIVAATLLFSLVSEFVFPALSADFTRDWWDFLAFGLGGLTYRWLYRTGAPADSQNGEAVIIFNCQYVRNVKLAKGSPPDYTNITDSSTDYFKG